MNGTKRKVLFGNMKILNLLLMFFYCSLASYASHIEVQLPWRTNNHIASDLILITGVTTNYVLPTPLFQLGETHTNINEKLSALECMDVVVAGTVVEVVPIAITGLKEWYNQSAAGPLYWYRIKCEVADIIKGVFPSSSFEFVATYGIDRRHWQFVQGYAFYFGMQEGENGLTIMHSFRTSPLPPYKIEDHVNYFQLKRENPDFDWSQSDAFINQVCMKMGRKRRDVSIEKSEYLLITFNGDELWGGLNIDYGKSVTIITNNWVFPLP